MTNLTKRERQIVEWLRREAWLNDGYASDAFDVGDVSEHARRSAQAKSYRVAAKLIERGDPWWGEGDGA